MPKLVFIVMLVDCDIRHPLVVSASMHEAKEYIRKCYPEAMWNILTNRYEIDDADSMDIQWFEIEEVRFIG